MHQEASYSWHAGGSDLGAGSLENSRLRGVVQKSPKEVPHCPAQVISIIVGCHIHMSLGSGSIFLSAPWALGYVSQDLCLYPSWGLPECLLVKFIISHCLTGNLFSEPFQLSLKISERQLLRCGQFGEEGETGNPDGGEDACLSLS